MIVPQSLLDAVVIDSTSPSGLVWASDGGPRRRAGNKVGSRSDRYWNTRWAGKMYKVHRIIMVKLYGQSDMDIDHLDRDVFNNHPDNLRWCDHSTNMKNRVFKPKANGLPQGIYQNTTGGYRFRRTGSWSKTYKTLQEAINENSNHQHSSQLPLVR
jgi:hypothetical protein